MSLVREAVSGLRPTCLLAFALFALVRPERAGASPIRFVFQGTVEQSTTRGINVGDPFTGTLSYDTDLPRPAPQKPNVGTYTAPAPFHGIQLQVEVGSRTFKIDDPDFAGIVVARGTEIWGGPSHDFFQATISDATGGRDISLLLGGLPGKTFTTTALPTDMNMSMFPNGSLLSFTDNSVIDPDTWAGASFGGPVTSLTPVPEPSVLAVFALAALGYGLRRRTGR